MPTDDFLKKFHSVLFVFFPFLVFLTNKKITFQVYLSKCSSDYAYIINDCQFQHSGTKASMSQMRTFPILLLIHIARMYLGTMQKTDLLKYYYPHIRALAHMGR
jgi:hypothetical protein